MGYMRGGMVMISLLHNTEWGHAAFAVYENSNILVLR